MTVATAPGTAPGTGDAYSLHKATMADHQYRIAPGWPLDQVSEALTLWASAFLGLDEAESLAAANKRIGNILKKAALEKTGNVNRKLLTENNEISLFEALTTASDNVRPMVEKRQYTEALAALASLRGPVDKFFDDVMVMADDERVRNNRLALLSELRALFLEIADISRLAIA